MDPLVRFRRLRHGLEQRGWSRVLFPDLAPVAGLDVFRDVSVHSRPPVALKEPFLGLVDPVVSGQGVAMRGLDGGGSHR